MGLVCCELKVIVLSRGRFGHVWGHFWAFTTLGVGKAHIYGILWIEDRVVLVLHPTMHRTDSPNTDLSGPKCQ